MEHGSSRGRGRNRGRGRGQGRGRGRGFGGSENYGSRSNHSQRDNAPQNSSTYNRSDNNWGGDMNGEINAHLTERFNGRPRRNPANSVYSETPMYRTAANPDIARYVLNQKKINDLFTDPDNWLSKPEIPSHLELQSTQGTQLALPQNRIDRPWSKYSSYLKTHYILLREDAIAPLREAVDKYRRDPHRMDDHDLRIYEQVRVVGLTFTFKGIATRVRFSTARSGRKIKWSASKRLTSGTLVALSPVKDGFKTICILAVVAARPLQNLEVNPPEIDLLFGDVNNHEVDPQTAFVMVESSQGYFEAYRHTLTALQKQSQEVFPLADHICQLNPSVEPPEYLKANPEINMIPAADDETTETYRNVNVIEDWPPAPSGTLDPTQWSAMRDILTKKLAIVQGPPGTGKTHVSKIAIQIMLANRSSNDTPMIIACQTNHALDQLLELIYPFEPGFIRLGGRSTNVLVKKRSLHEVRKSEVIDELTGSCLNKARRDLSLLTMKLKGFLSPLSHDASPLVTAERLFERNIIDAAQLKSLQRGADQWMRSDNSTAEPLESWLGKAVVPFTATYNDDSFGFEEDEDDLELEQLRELEAETGIADEEDVELLKGDFISLNMGMTMDTPTPQTMDQAKRMLDTTRDMYRVPEHLRGPMYMVMQERFKAMAKRELREQAYAYEAIATQIQIGRWEKDLAYLSKAPIIGMTTTGLSKYRALVSALKPKIVLIEEAAEVLEGPVGVACVESLEHLILVGDHQQLQASCSVNGLKGEPFHLNISMFERLVRNGLPHKTLLRQRRMAPEIRELIAKSYPNLEDHSSVIDRPRPQYGMGTVSTWFLNHDWQEMQDVNMSTYNEQEARLIAKFYRHLIRNGVPAASITVLTFYNGQRKKILQELKEEPETKSIYNKVKTVDSYQGEENTIVILSLVRNNIAGKIGFLDINNRVVVALSRAKYGFYIFGNGGFLAEHNELWDYVDEKMFQTERSDTRMPLTCAKHGTTVWVKHAEDFDQFDGGCHRRCDGVLLCGHKCPLKCHIYPHESVQCHIPCRKELICGHFCLKTCKEDCGCDCEVYRLHIGEMKAEPETAEPAEVSVPVQNSEYQLTAANVSKIPYNSEHGMPSYATTQLSEAPISNVRPGKTNSATRWTERTVEMENGRVRYEQEWRPQHPAEPPSIIAQLKLQDVDKNVRQSAKVQPPAVTKNHKSRAIGLDGCNDHDSPQPGSVIEEVSLLRWDSQPVTQDKAIADWADPESIEWQQEHEIAMQSENFW